MNVRPVGLIMAAAGQAEHATSSALLQIKRCFGCDVKGQVKLGEQSTHSATSICWHQKACLLSDIVLHAEMGALSAPSFLHAQTAAHKSQTAALQP